MNITADKVVEIEYVLKVRGEVLDQSEPGETLTYLHGHHNIVPGLESALEGHAVGDEVKVTVPPEQGYGLRDEDATDELSREDFEDDLELGATYSAEAADGSVYPFTVRAVEGDRVSVDFNPPLAGETLDFEVKVVSVRDATPEELEDGIAHTGTEFGG